MRELKKPNREVMLLDDEEFSIQAVEASPPGNDTIKIKKTKSGTRENAYRMNNRYTLASAMAGAMPLPGADIVAVSAIQTDMVLELASLYGLRVSRKWGAKVAVMLATGMTVSTGMRSLFSIMKTLPAAGTILGGGSAATASAATTYLIGKVLIEHFEKGGGLDSIAMPKLKKMMKDEKISSMKR